MRTTYQKEIPQLKRQQEILQALKFYTGVIDGIWGPKSIEAMMAYERDPLFIPGIPNHGMPLSELEPSPVNINKDESSSKAMRLFTHTLLNKPKDIIPPQKTVEQPHPKEIDPKELEPS